MLVRIVASDTKISTMTKAANSPARETLASLCHLCSLSSWFEVKARIVLDRMPQKRKKAKVTVASVQRAVPITNKQFKQMVKHKSKKQFWGTCLERLILPNTATPIAKPIPKVTGKSHIFLWSQGLMPGFKYGMRDMSTTRRSQQLRIPYTFLKKPTRSYISSGLFSWFAFTTWRNLF